MRRFDLQTTSDTAKLAPTRRAVEAFCASCGFSEKASGEVGLCVNEAMANVIRHAYGGASNNPIRIQAEFMDDALHLTLRDWGNGKTPAFIPDAHDPLTPGGLGLICLRTLMDDMVFHPQADGMLLEMKRKLPPPR